MKPAHPRGLVPPLGGGIVCRSWVLRAAAEARGASLVHASLQGSTWGAWRDAGTARAEAQLLRVSSCLRVAPSFLRFALHWFLVDLGTGLL